MAVAPLTNARWNSCVEAIGRAGIERDGGRMWVRCEDMSVRVRVGCDKKAVRVMVKWGSE